jgi:hypothetical protein
MKQISISIMSFMILSSSIFSAVGGIGKDNDYSPQSNQGRPLQIDTSKIDIIFEKSEYLDNRTSGNISINFSLRNKMSRQINTTLRGDVSIYNYISEINIIVVPNDITINLTPYEIINKSFKILMVNSKRFQIGYSFQFNIHSTKSDDNYYCANHTKYSNIVPISIKMIKPAVNEGTYVYRVGEIKSPTNFLINITNYFESTINAIINGKYLYDKWGKEIEVKGKSSLIIQIPVTFPQAFIDGVESDFNELRFFYISTGNFTSYIGYDNNNNDFTNITCCMINTYCVPNMKIEMSDRIFQLNIPKEIKIYITSKLKTVQKNVRFEIHISGILSDRISHEGTIFLEELQPDNQTTINYSIFPHISGRFIFSLSGNLDNHKIIFTSEITITDDISLETNYYSMSNKKILGQKFLLQVAITNYYSVPIDNLKIRVVLTNREGFLMQQDFIIIDQNDRQINIIESGGTRHLSFNITFRSSGSYELYLVAFWANNASINDDEKRIEYLIKKPEANISTYYGLIMINTLVIIPKIIDIWVRKKRKIE